MQSYSLTESVDILLANPYLRVMLIVLSAMIAQVIARALIGILVRQIVGYSYRGRTRSRYKSKTDERKREHTLISLFRTAASVLIWIVATLSILVAFGMQLSTLLTSAGLLGVIIGFGAQNLIKDILGGLFVIGENQYRVGDVAMLVVNGREVSGEVEDVTIRITKLRDLDGRLHIVRNGSADVVVNYTFDYANVNIDMDVAYESDIDAVEDAINRVGDEMSEDSEWGHKIVEPIRFLRVDDLEGASIRVKALGKVKPSAQWEVAGEFRRRIKTEFDKNNITMGTSA